MKSKGHGVVCCANTGRPGERGIYAMIDKRTRELVLMAVHEALNDEQFERLDIRIDVHDLNMGQWETEPPETYHSKTMKIIEIKLYTDES